MTDTKKIALVTGAGSGVGRESVFALANAGWHVALVARREAPLQEIAHEIGLDRTLVLPADVADPAAVESVFAKLEDTWGRIDLLFNNAGGGAPSMPIDEVSVEQWLRTVSINLTGSFLCARLAFGLMRRQRPSGGRIINNGSVSAHVPRPGSAPYTSTKHGITGLTKSIALDGRPFGISCGQIDIGNAATPMTTRMATGVIQPNGSMIVEATMDAKHVADTLVHMASLPPEANIPFVTVMATTMPFLGRG